MSLSACITVNDRSVETMTQVFDSMKCQAFDQFVIVLDSPKAELASFCRSFWEGDSRVEFVEILRASGWRSPVKAWNSGYARVTGKLLYCFSSETVQVEGNLLRARLLLADHPDTLIMGKAECSCGPVGQEVNWNGSAPGNLLSDAAHPRPMGFIWAAPMKNVREIGGWDEAFDGGFWHDESDFFLRLWRTGLDFLFTDSVHGVHQHHDRPVLATPEGQAGIRSNAALMMAKHGTLHPWPNLPKLIQSKPGETRWMHL